MWRTSLTSPVQVQSRTNLPLAQGKEHRLLLIPIQIYQVSYFPLNSFQNANAHHTSPAFQKMLSLQELIRSSLAFPGAQNFRYEMTGMGFTTWLIRAKCFSVPKCTQTAYRLPHRDSFHQATALLQCSPSPLHTGPSPSSSGKTGPASPASPFLPPSRSPEPSPLQWD